MSLLRLKDIYYVINEEYFLIFNLQFWVKQIQFIKQGKYLNISINFI